MKLVTTHALCVLALFGPDPAASYRIYEHWYHEYRPQLIALTNTTCAPQYGRYLADPMPLPNCLKCKVQPFVECLLANFEETQKANMVSKTMGKTLSSFRDIG